MRIALLSTVPSTLAVFYRPLIDALVQHGCRITIVSAPGRELESFRRPASDTPRTASQTHAGSVEVFPVPFTRRITPWRDARAWVRLVRFFRREGFELVHTHTPKAGLLGMTAARRAGVPRRIHTLHGLTFETSRGWKRTLLMRSDRTACAAADTVCAVSASVRETAIRLRLCDPERCVILGSGSACGVDLHRFRREPDTEMRGRRFRERFGIPASATVIGYCGWLVADKGIDDLVEAFARLADRNESAYLLLVGRDGTRRDPIRPATRRLIETHPRIVRAGWTDDPPAAYAAMDILVLPTRREGFPYALLEAAAMELPVVATRVTGCVDAVIEGETGVLVAAGDIAALERAIVTLLHDATRRRTMGRRGRERAEREFDARRLVEAHLRLYGLRPKAATCVPHERIP